MVLDPSSSYLVIASIRLRLDPHQKGLDERGNPIYDVLGYTANREDGYRMLDDYLDNPFDPDLRNISLGKLYERWKRVELPDLGRQNQKKMLYCYKWIQHLEKKKYRLIDYYDMKSSIDNCDKSNNTKGSIKSAVGAPRYLCSQVAYHHGALLQYT